MGRDQKKQAKQKERERKKAAQKNHAELVERKRRQRDQYPKVLIDPTNGDPEFVELVRKAHSEIDLANPQLFRSGVRTFYRLMRERGYSYALHVLKTKCDEGQGINDFGVRQTILAYGDILLDRIPEDARRRLMPYNDAFTEFRHQEIIVKFSSMLSHMGPAGRTFYSRRKPTIQFEGEERIVAFSRHAIERICERLNPRYIQYAAAGDVHAFFSSCVYFEPVMLYGNQPAFTLYSTCGSPPFAVYHTYVMQVFGEENVDSSKGIPYYKVGYCPVVFEDGYAKAKTFLFPGYAATPEYGLLLQSKLSRAEREMLIQSSTSLDANEVLVNDNPETIKWFHDHGIPQVVQMKQTVFAR